MRLIYGRRYYKLLVRRQHYKLPVQPSFFVGEQIRMSACMWGMEREEKDEWWQHMHACIHKEEKENGYTCASTQFQTKKIIVSKSSVQIKIRWRVALVSERASKQDPTPTMFQRYIFAYGKMLFSILICLWILQSCLSR